MTPEELLRTVTDSWAADPDNDVVWAGDHEGRRGVRMRQTVRDFTTVWFGMGERTVSIEAGVLPQPRANQAEVYRQCLLRSRDTRRVHFAVDRDGEVLLVGRIPVEELSEDELSTALAEVWDLVEVAFPALVRLAFAREKDS